ncbi:guanylate kinase [candidate division GN15 bacterium]|uniref:Guanylate kinase n=1 Tax=candidate division GN15 bacterium TaxID=2072418 RepID=A0A855X3A2_9BACT|nr:MAG: guanylate kinase [candidate division GN15 bacterium]
MSSRAGEKSTMRAKHPGSVVIISSPSGGGKTSICRRLLSRARRRHGWTFSVSYTTRRTRVGERNGREYFFVSDEKFEQLARSGFFAEHFHVHTHRYGTPRRPLEQVLRNGGVMILDVDVQGAFKLRKEYPDAVTIFILPPSVRELRRRLRQRGTETVEQLAIRFENARREMKLYRKFEYVVVNQALDLAVQQVLAIIGAHGCRVDKVDKEQMQTITG